MKSKILLVEDNLNMGFLLAEYLEDNNFAVKLCKDGEDGLKEWQSGNYNFCVFDIMLPKMDGFTLAKKVRNENKRVPIILLTAKSMKEDKIHGFNIGIDDYITKPFDEEELLCRINAVLMRSANKMEIPTENSFKIGKYDFDPSNLALKNDGCFKRLTKKESAVLTMLCSLKNKVTKRDDILYEIWGDNNYFNGRSLDVFITKLRKYLKDDPIIKIEGIPTVGYILSDK